MVDKAMLKEAATNMETELVELIASACNIPDIPSSIDPDAPLIGPDSPLGLDSLDAVEVVVAVQKRYDVRIGGQESSREVLRSLRSLGDYIGSERK